MEPQCQRSHARREFSIRVNFQLLPAVLVVYLVCHPDTEFLSESSQESAGSHQDASVGPGAYISIGNAQRQSHPQPPGIWLQTCNAEDISICTIAQIAFMLPGTLSRWCLYYASLPARCIGSSATQYSCVIMVDLIIIYLIGLLETYDFWLTAHTSGGIGETREAHQHVR